MPLDHEYRKLVESQLDECDAALADKPNLAAIFDEQWRKEHRERMLNADSPFDVSYPSTYAKPHQDIFYPPDYQQRLEEGAGVLLPKLDDGEKNHLIQRMRGSGGPSAELSAEEELLLARGFAEEFGADAISFPSVLPDQDTPEFHVTVQGHAIEIEAKGLIDEQEVRELNKHAMRTGQLCWTSYSPSIGNIGRLRAAVAKKLLTKATGAARVLVLTQYTPWITPVEGVPLIRTLATNPAQFDIPEEKHALAIAYVTDRWITGVWFNADVVSRLGLDVKDRESMRGALKASFYSRSGDVFFHEQQGEAEQGTMIATMIRIAHGG